MSRAVVLDCEAVQALASPTHPHHRHVVALMQVVSDRKTKARAISAVVPTAVRVEADLDRTAPGASFFNSLRVLDHALNSEAANTAAALHARHGVSVPDAHVGACVAGLGPTTDVTVVTSDPRDMRRVTAGRTVTVVKL